jgi:hypothetical protein
MAGWIVSVVLFALLFWQIRRARQKAAELMASGEGRSPLYWTGIALVMTALALTMYMARPGPGEMPWPLWFLVMALLVATLVVRRALKWRYPH